MAAQHDDDDSLPGGRRELARKKTDRVRLQPLSTAFQSGGDAHYIASDDRSPEFKHPRYELRDVIEYGGMGIIYDALDRQLSRPVAIKILRRDRLDNPTAIKGITNEARVMSYLAHRCVTPIYECGTCSDGRPFYVMRRIDGCTFADLLSDQNAKASRVLSIFADLCQTVAFAHSRGIIHLDLKPNNVMVGAFGQVYLMDWGLARFHDLLPIDFADQSITIDAASDRANVNGTPEYMSPEQALGRKLDPRADVFSLGAILCEILTGQAPYQGSSLPKVFARAMNAKLANAMSALDNCRADHVLKRLAKQCLSRSMNKRPASALEVAQEMVAYQETALQLAESDMHRFFELSLDLFCIAGMDGYFRRINANFARVLGHEAEQLMSKPFMDFVHPEDRDQTINAMSVLDKGQPIIRFRNRYITAGGDYVTLEWTAKLIEEQGVIFAVARDVSHS